MPWLTQWEREEVIFNLLRFSLIKFSNNRDLPLKNGGKTDIYINLRDARNYPEAIKYFSEVFANPLRRLKPDRFFEVPDAVSCFAGPISIQTGIPMVTARREAKSGRVAKAKVIGNPNFGEKVCIFDDVITNGASKLLPYHECVSMGLKLLPLIVLVDRQQGWQRDFRDLNINMDLWPGMTLHDIRKYLIDNGVMERCDKELEEKNPLIVALDGKSWEEVLPVIDQLRTTGCILKVNDLLFNKGIENLIPNLHVYGRVMADLKSHDIPSTVENITKHLLPNPPWGVTIHGSGGEEMIRAAVDTLKGTETKVLAVTVLTSINQETGEEIYRRIPISQVKVLAEIAMRAGAHGFVCSPEEVPMLRKKYPRKLIVTPGICSSEVGANDQKRIGTPADTLRKGSNYLVMGRQIFGAADPVQEVIRLFKEEIKVT